MERPRRARGSPGVSLIEMIVVLAIVAMLSAMAAPYARKAVQREKELALRGALRDTRLAIDRFHADWLAAKGAGGFAKAASPDGYPVTLEALAEGVEGAGPSGSRRRYLRQTPRNPLAPATAPPDEHWRFIAYQDDPKAEARAGAAKDIYDLRPNTPGNALDGTAYADW